MTARAVTATPSTDNSLIDLIEAEELTDVQLAEIQAKIDEKKKKRAADIEAKLYPWKLELEEYVKTKYGVSLHKIFMAADPNAPAKESKSDRPKPGQYKINGQWRVWTETSRKTGDAKDYDFAGAEARGEYRE